MKYLYHIILLLIIYISISSCNKDGCTDCNATNYDVSANKDDGSCKYLNESRLGMYVVSDSIIDPFQTIFYSSYKIEIKHNKCMPSEMLISNFGDIKNSLKDPITIVCEISGDSIFIKQQIIEGPDANSTTDFIQVSQSYGYFSNDSIYFSIRFSDRFDPYYGNCWGKKM